MSKKCYKKVSCILWDQEIMRSSRTTRAKKPLKPSGFRGFLLFSPHSKILSQIWPMQGKYESGKATEVYYNGVVIKPTRWPILKPITPALRLVRSSKYLSTIETTHGIKTGA